MPLPLWRRMKHPAPGHPYCPVVLHRAQVPPATPSEGMNMRADYVASEAHIGPLVTRRSAPAPLSSTLAASAATVLETKFPYRELSLVAKADRRAVDPTYAAHRWWARRPPSVMRGILLAAALEASTPLTRFWQLFRHSTDALEGLRVFDPFAGGGSTLVEAARLGAVPCGVDVDPLAVQIVAHELDPPNSTDVATVGATLLAHLESTIGHLYASTHKGWTPLHYFSIQVVSCPQCSRTTPLYRSLIIARDVGKNGGVVREACIVAFCPECFSVHQLDSHDRKELWCCSRRKLTDATYEAQRFTCPHCETRSTHRELRTGIAERHLFAVEETRHNSPRRIRKASDADFLLTTAAEDYLQRHDAELEYPRAKLSEDRIDARPLSFGIRAAADLFTARQLAVFGHAFKWVRTEDMTEATRRALTLGMSNALATNNRLCGYAADYGRLAPLFSVRSYSLPWLAVELNPFHPSGGRGTLRRILARIARSGGDQVRRYVWSQRHKVPEAVMTDYSHPRRRPELFCQSASTDLVFTAGHDFCMFDPPYFDYIAYSELSEFYRVWLPESQLGGKPLLPDRDDPTLSFGHALGGCIKRAVCGLNQGSPIAFTYHSASQDAWDAIGVALDSAELWVTALWPVRNDAHMGHHTANGNCEWDVIVVCRQRRTCSSKRCRLTVKKWCSQVKPLKVRKADKLSMHYAISMASTRFGSSHI
jgi:putative DNA methylase